MSLFTSCGAGLATQALYVWVFTGSDPLNTSFNYNICQSWPSTGGKPYMQLHRLESLPPDKADIDSIQYCEYS